MIFYTINKFIADIIAKNPDVKNVVIAYLTKDSKTDKFNKNVVYPLYIIYDTGDEKIKLDYEDIITEFTEEIAISLNKENVSASGVACCLISAESKYSDKFKCDFHQKNFLTPGQGIIREVNKSNKKKQEHTPATYDI